MPAVGILLNPIAFERQMIRLANRVGSAVGVKTQAAIAEAVYLGIVTRTPVLTARARGNWTPTVGAPSEDVGDHLNAGVSTTYAPPTAEERVKAKAIKQKLEALPLGQSIAYITNRLDYIQRLEDGSLSKKVPRKEWWSRLS